jgi:hypothetical protein
MITMEWTTLAGTLSSTALGGGLALFGVHLSSRRSEKLRREEILRTRGEELYALNADFLKGLGSYFLRRVSVMYGNLTYNQMLDQEIDDLKGRNLNLGRMEMLVDVYFANARPSFDRMMKARDTLNEVALEHKRAYAAGELRSDRFVSRFKNAMDNVDAAGKSLADIVVIALRSL